MGSEADALTALQAAEVDRRLRFSDPFKHARLSAFLDGFSLHAGVRLHGNARAGLERLCRYALRPPFALQRLSKGEDGRLVYRMKWHPERRLLHPATAGEGGATGRADGFHGRSLSLLRGDVNAPSRAPPRRSTPCRRACSLPSSLQQARETAERLGPDAREAPSGVHGAAAHLEGQDVVVRRRVPGSGVA